MRKTLLFFTAMLGATPVQAADLDPLDNIRRQLIARAPFKQWDLQTGSPVLSIGRTPGATCEAISFFAADIKMTGNVSSRSKGMELAAWVMQLQATRGAAAGGVPSTPDLPSPSNGYYYALDAAFCGTAMLDMAAAVGDQRYTKSAIGFGNYILRSTQASANYSNDPLDDQAPCEYMIQRPRRAEWHCQHYVKNLVALPFLARLEKIMPGKGYGIAAARLRNALVPGLMNLWEYYDPTGKPPSWRRIDGPYRQPDHFIYGDTIAYALQGLAAYEGGTPQVRELYARIAGAKGTAPAVSTYNGHGAWAGYLLANGQPDPASAYYDVVTLGLLHPVRLRIAPTDAIQGREQIRTKIANQPLISWKMSMDGTMAQTGTGDISTLAALGKALLQ